ncbi:MAG: heme exporter protein CcmD [Aquabacterium sp.]|nr:heme exporter protein CcmD [Aquabacterium sp.]
MTWNSASEFFAMGGYGLYVWGSYAATAALMLLEPLLVQHRHRQALRDAAAQTDHTETDQ